MSDLHYSVSNPCFSGVIGVARADITPPVGIYHRNWGAATHDVAEGIHRPLRLTILTLQEKPDTPPLVLAAADLGWWRDPKDEWYVRGAVLDALGLDPARFLLNFSHTHAGPVLCRDDADKPGGHLIAPYLDSLRDALIDTTRQALAAAVPATLDFAYGKCDLAANRDLPAPDGSGRYLSGFNPNAPADDTLTVGRVFDTEGVLRGTLVNYACHPTTLAYENRLISPDFVGKMRERQEWGGGKVPCLFLQGASGELAPRDQYTVPGVPVPTGYAEKNGHILAGSVDAVMAGMLPPNVRLEFDRVVESGAPLAVWKTVPREYPSTLEAIQVNLELPLKPEWQGETDEERQWAASGDAASLERLRRRQRIRRALGGGATAKIPLWVWRIGDALLVAHPNEAYSQLQTELRAAFPDTAVVVMNVTNGWYGYLPPADTYDTDRYAVWQTPFARGGLEMLIAASKREIERLRGSS